MVDFHVCFKCTICDGSLSQEYVSVTKQRYSLVHGPMIEEFEVQKHTDEKPYSKLQKILRRKS